MSYFKYTNGESFTLDNSDYLGFFNIVDGVAYSGQSLDTESDELSPKNTFLANLYLNRKETNTTYQNIEQPVANLSNSFDIFDNQGMKDLTSNITGNNLVCVKGLVLANPTVYKYEENKCFFYGLSSVAEGGSPTTIPAKQNYLGHVEPFSKIPTFSYLDEVFSGAIVVNASEDFKYVCTNGEGTFTFKGNYGNKAPLELLSVYDNISFVSGTRGYENPDYVYSIHHDQYKKKILYVKSSTIEVHDATTYGECDNTVLEDIITLKESKFKFMKWTTPDEIWSAPEIRFTWDSKYTVDNPNNPNSIRFGYNYRTLLDDNLNLLLLNKYSSDVFTTLSLKALGIGDVLDLDIRAIDDYIIILHNLLGKMTVTQFDPTDTSTILHGSIESVNLNGANFKVKFVDYDSDIFILSNDVEYQTRYLSKPTYPSGRLETCELDYSTPTTWNNTLEFWNYIPTKWDTSNNKANFYKNLATATTLRNNKMYMLLHNVGRLYAIAQPMNDRFLASIPLDLPQKFEGVVCSDSSIGIQLNIIIRNLLDDTLSILRNASNSFVIEEREVLHKEIQDYTIIVDNLYMNGNETFNVLMLQRILFQILELQKRIIPS